jgi:hypothetical protein
MVARKVEDKIEYKPWLDDYSVIDGLTPYERAEKESLQYQLKAVEVLAGVGNYFKKIEFKDEETDK